MDDATATIIRRLVNSRLTASLGTLHDGAPHVSMVPYALQADEPCFVIHVSRLSAHTADMLAEPRVSLLICAPEEKGVSPQGLPRLTVSGLSRQLAPGAAETVRARKVYLDRYPESAPMFGFGDFSLFAIALAGGRWVGGFGRAFSLAPEVLAQVLRGPGS